MVFHNFMVFQRIMSFRVGICQSISWWEWLPWLYSWLPQRERERATFLYHSIGHPMPIFSRMPIIDIWWYIIQHWIWYDMVILYLIVSMVIIIRTCYGNISRISWKIWRKLVQTALFYATGWCWHLFAMWIIKALLSHLLLMFSGCWNFGGFRKGW